MKNPSFSETAEFLKAKTSSVDQIDSPSISNLLCQIEESPLVALYSESLLSPVNDDKDFVNFDDMDDETFEESLKQEPSRKNYLSPESDMMMMLNCDEILNPFKISKFEVYKDCSSNEHEQKIQHMKNKEGLKLRRISSDELELSQNSVFNSYHQDIPYPLYSSLELDMTIRARSTQIHYYDSYFTLFKSRKIMQSMNLSSIDTMKYSSSYSSSGILDIFARKKFFYSEDHWKERKQIKDSRVSKSLPEKLSNSRILFFSEEDLPKRQKKEIHLPEEGDQELHVTEGISVTFQLGKSYLNFVDQEIPILLTIKDNNCFVGNYTKDVCIIVGLQSIDVEQLEHAFIEIGRNLNENDRLSVMMMDDEEFLIKMCQADCEILKLVRNLVTLKQPGKRKNFNIFSCLIKTVELLSERRYQSNFTSIIILTDTIYQNKLSHRMGLCAVKKFLTFLERRNLLNDSRFSIYAIGYGDSNFNILGEICYCCRGEFNHIKNSSELIEPLQFIIHQAFSKKYFDISLIIETNNGNEIAIPNTFVKTIQEGRIFQVKIPILKQGEEKHLLILAKVVGLPKFDKDRLLSLFTVYCQARRHENEITMKKRHSETIYVDIDPFCVKVMTSHSSQICKISMIVYLHYLRVLLTEVLEKFTMFYLREEFEVADGIFKKNKEFNSIVDLLDANISQMGLYEKFFYDYLNKVLKTVMRIGKTRKYSNLHSNYLLIMTHTLFSEVPYPSSCLLSDSDSKEI